MCQFSQAKKKKRKKKINSNKREIWCSGVVGFFFPPKNDFSPWFQTLHSLMSYMSDGINSLTAVNPETYFLSLVFLPCFSCLQLQCPCAWLSAQCIYNQYYAWTSSLTLARALSVKSGAPKKKKNPKKYQPFISSQTVNNMFVQQQTQDLCFHNSLCSSTVVEVSEEERILGQPMDVGVFLLLMCFFKGKVCDVFACHSQLARISCCKRIHHNICEKRASAYARGFSLFKNTNSIVGNTNLLWNLFWVKCFSEYKT